MMALRPELVQIEKLPKDLSDKPLGLLGEYPRKHASFDIVRSIIERQLNNLQKILNESLKNLQS